MVTIEYLPDGKVKVTYNLQTVWLTRAEAEAAASDQDAAAELLKRFQ